MLHGHVRQQTVPEQMAWQHAGGPRPDGAAAARTIFSLQAVVDGLAAERFHIDDGAFPAALCAEPPATVRTRFRPGDKKPVLGLFRREAPPSPPPMAGPRPAGRARGLARRGIGFDGQFCRRGRGAEESLPGRALLIAQAILEPGVFLPEAVNLPLLLQAVRTITQTAGVRGQVLGLAARSAR